MSNSLAIAATTVALSGIVRRGIGGIDGAQVTTVRPEEKDETETEPRANLFLYQVAQNAALGNEDLPTRSAGGELRSRPWVGLDLHYLISFYGNERTLEPQRLLGGVVAALRARPQVTKAAIQEIVSAAAKAGLEEPAHFLGGTDLGAQLQRLALTPEALDLEQLSRLWSVLFRAPYALSVAYRASVVVVEPPLAPRPALPVRRGAIRALPLKQPAIVSVGAAAGQGEPIVAGSTLALRGERLRGEETRVRIGKAVVSPPPAAIGETEIQLELEPPLFPAGTLRAGVQVAQVVHMLELGTPPSPHRGFESNAAPFVVQPLIESLEFSASAGGGPGAGSVEVVGKPPIGARQRVTLLLDEVSGAAALSFPAPQRKLDGDPVRIPVGGLVAGEYLARIRVDGAESPLEAETEPGGEEGRYTAPILSIP